MIILSLFLGRLKGNVGHRHFSNCGPFLSKKGEDKKDPLKIVGYTYGFVGHYFFLGHRHSACNST